MAKYNSLLFTILHKIERSDNRVSIEESVVKSKAMRNNYAL